MRLYKAAGQVCAMLAHVSNDLGFGHAAIAQARVAQRCADYAEYSGLTAYTTRVWSNVLYWEERHNDAAELDDDACQATYLAEPVPSEHSVPDRRPPASYPGVRDRRIQAQCP